MIRFAGTKLTADQFARFAVFSDGLAADYWHERYEAEYLDMTQREVDAVDAAIAKHSDRVRNFLRVESIHNHIWPEG